MNLAHPHAFAAVVSAIFGLVIGSFAGVVADRVPRGESVVKPPSHCVNCSTELRVVDNIPVVSYLLLRGRCRVCHVHIPPRDLYIEIATGLIFAALAWRLPSFWALPAYCFLATGLVALSAIDWERRLLPRSVLYPVAALFTAAIVLGSWPSHRFGHLEVAAIAAAGGFAGFLLIWFVVPKAMGFGDVRLAGLCGGALGWLGGGAALVGLVGSFFLAGIPAVWMLLRGSANRKTAIAFGPYLAMGGVLGVCFGETIARAWLKL